MRTIKFRAWDEADKEMSNFSFTNNLVCIDDKDDLHICSKSGGWDFYREGLHIMQFTGLLDKNGKEIWEDDVVMVRSQYEIEEGDTPIESINKVYFRDGAFRCGFHNMILGESVCSGSDGNWNMEVIGNIHENPELLT